MVAPSRIRMTAAEFFQLPETNRPTELIAGELIVSPTSVPKHQRGIRRLLMLLEGLIPRCARVLDGRPMGAYLEVWRLEGGKFVRQGVYGAEDKFESAVLDGKMVDVSKTFGN